MRHFPTSSLICNFEPPKGIKPYLLNNQDRVSLFHELGHSIHDIVSKTTFARCHGPPATPVDFGEAPSQLLEHWCWRPEILQKLSKHWSYLSQECFEEWKKEAHEAAKETQQPEQRLSVKSVEKLTESRKGQILLHLGELQRSIFDMIIHQPTNHEALEQMDFSSEWARLGNELIAVDYDDDIKPNNRFMMVPQFVENGDYSAGYYGYFYCQVFADDIFRTIFESDPMNAEAGLRYRRLLLEKGGSENGLKLVEDILGRKPSVAAFHKKLGLV
jgi:metallopeptidase MepB